MIRRGEPPFRSAAALGAAALHLAACGARSSLEESFAGVGGTSASATSASASASSGAGAGGPTCKLDDLSTWRAERYRDGGDYERTAVALSGVPWVALKVRDGNIVLAKLGLDPAKGIVFDERIEIPNSPVYPVGLDVDADRFVMLTTTGINWNGDAALWRIDRHTQAVKQVPVGAPPADPANTIDSALGLAGSNVVLAYGRLAQGDGVIELRDDELVVTQSSPIASTTYTAVHPKDGAVDVYLGPSGSIHAEAGSLTTAPTEQGWQVIGGYDGFLVEIGQQIRLSHGQVIATGPWPHTQISPPAILRTDGDRAAFSLETELTAVVGHTTSKGLEWLAIESTPDAPGTGLGLLPVIEKGRLGLFYLGLEIPHPEQPLRYYGLECH